VIDMARRLHLRKDQEEINRKVDSWTPDDERLAGMPDPLKHAGPSDEVVAVWNRHFWQALAREPYTLPPLSDDEWLARVDPAQIDIAILRVVLGTGGAGVSPTDQGESLLRRIWRHMTEVKR
jgi:hypothetical protein